MATDSKNTQKYPKIPSKTPILGYFTLFLAHFYQNFVAKYFLKSGQKKYANLAQKEEAMYITMPQLFYKILLFIHKTCVRKFIS